MLLHVKTAHRRDKSGPGRFAWACRLRAMRSHSTDAMVLWPPLYFPRAGQGAGDANRRVAQGHMFRLK